MEIERKKGSRFLARVGWKKYPHISMSPVPDCKYIKVDNIFTLKSLVGQNANSCLIPKWK